MGATDDKIRSNMVNIEPCYPISLPYKEVKPLLQRKARRRWVREREFIVTEAEDGRGGFGWTSGWEVDGV